MCVCVRERERENVCVCVCVRERDVRDVRYRGKGTEDENITNNRETDGRRE